MLDVPKTFVTLPLGEVMRVPAGTRIDIFGPRVVLEPAATVLSELLATAGKLLPPPHPPSIVESKIIDAAKQYDFMSFSEREYNGETVHCGNKN